MCDARTWHPRACPGAWQPFLIQVICGSHRAIGFQQLDHSSDARGHVVEPPFIGRWVCIEPERFHPAAAMGDPLAAVLSSSDSDQWASMRRERRALYWWLAWVSIASFSNAIGSFRRVAWLYSWPCPGVIRRTPQRFTSSRRRRRWHQAAPAGHPVEGFTKQHRLGPELPLLGQGDEAAEGAALDVMILEGLLQGSLRGSWVSSSHPWRRQSRRPCRPVGAGRHRRPGRSGSRGRS